MLMLTVWLHRALAAINAFADQDSLEMDAPVLVGSTIQ